jgi:hypothetical protein
MRRYAIVVLLVLAAGCASLRGPQPEVTGPLLTITNEAFAPLDLSYRCTENGPVRRLGAVNPQRTATFVLRPAFCTTVYLIRVPLAGLQPIGIDKWGERPIAVIQMSEENTANVVFASPGVLVHRTPEPVEAESQDET